MKLSANMARHKDSINWRYEVNKQDIAYLCGLFEAYDELAVVRTLDQNRGFIELLISPDYVDDVNNFVTALQRELPIRKLHD